METVTVNAEALYAVLVALNGPPHYIRELQVIKNLPGGFNPIGRLIKEYSAAAEASTNEQTADANRLSREDVKWVTNDNAELGVKIGNQFFFLYKGGSLVYETGKHDNGSPMHWRPVGKREFGECAHPINHSDYSKIGTVSLGDSDEWQVLPPANG